MLDNGAVQAHIGIRIYPASVFIEGIFSAGYGFWILMDCRVPYILAANLFMDGLLDAGHSKQVLGDYASQCLGQFVRGKSQIPGKLRLNDIV